MDNFRSSNSMAKFNFNNGGDNDEKQKSLPFLSGKSNNFILRDLFSMALPPS